MVQEQAVVTSLEEIEAQKPTFLAIGVFDGVHKGHQQLLQNMTDAAHEAGAQAAVLTFFPHPIAVIQKRLGRLYICTLEERLKLLSRQGLDMVITQDFDEEVRQTRAAEYVRQLRDHLNLQQLWGGAFSLGYNREGDLEFLEKLGKDLNFTVHQVEAMVHWNGHRVSSSRVRGALTDGVMSEVNGCLGHNYRITGTVIHGDGRGRRLGIPTANIEIWDELILPANGVYATYATIRGERYQAAANVGYRPTVNGHSLNVEAHILNFDEEVYGEELILEFVHRVRDEQKFPDLNALVQQIKTDIEKVRKLLPLDNSY
jgi:riboflavin kinase/FMN adenylyltransferase